MKKQLLFGLLLAWSIIGVATAESINMQAISITTDPAPLEAGEDADLDFKIRNTGTGVAEDITITINDSYPFTVKPGRDRTRTTGNIQPLSEYYVSTEILVADDAPNGVNTLPITIGNDEFTTTKELRLDVEQDTADLQLANIKTTPSRLTPDMDDVTLSFDVINQGETDAENTVMNIALPAGFQDISTFSTRDALGTIQPGEQKTASFTVDITETARSGDIDLPITVRYGESDAQYEVEDELTLYLAGRPNLRLTDAQGDLVAGETNTLRLNITNKGREEAEAARVRAVEASDLPLEFESASEYLGTVEPGVNTTAVFDVTVDSDAPAKQYLLDFQLRGVNDETVYVNELTLPQDVGENNEESTAPWTYILIGGALLIGAGAYYMYRW